MMSLYVVTLNRVFWRRLYHLAETRYRLGEGGNDHDAAQCRRSAGREPGRPAGARGAPVSRTFRSPTAGGP